MNTRATGNKRALVTGGAGSLGSHLCDGLLGDGYKVVAADNLLTVNAAKSAIRQPPRFSLVKKDVCQHAEMGPVGMTFFTSQALQVRWTMLPTGSRPSASDPMEPLKPLKLPGAAAQSS